MGALSDSDRVYAAVMISVWHITDADLPFEYYAKAIAWDDVDWIAFVPSDYEKIYEADWLLKGKFAPYKVVTEDVENGSLFIGLHA